MSSIKTKWDLTLLYDSLSDTHIERDVIKTERAYKKFNKDFNNTINWLRQPKALLIALERYDALRVLPGERAMYYAHYVRELDGSRSDADALFMRLQDRLTKAGTQVMFFENRLSKIDSKIQERFLKSKALTKYKYYLERLFLEGEHTLTESEERVLALTSASRSSLWTSGVDKLINKQEVKIGEESMPINDVLSRSQHMSNTNKRRAWSKAAMKKLKNISEFPESEINALYTNKKTSDELRGFSNPYDATIMSYENNAKSVLSLTKVVTDNFKLVHQFYKIKKEMLGLSEMQYADRSAPIGKSNKKVTFSMAVDTVRDAIYDVSDIYGDMFTKMIENGQVDVYPSAGKSGGAYCSGGVNTPTFLLLNQTDDLNSLYTLAHEMGHAIHTERSKCQPVIYQGYSTAVAETASTFFERVVFDKIFESLSNKEKVIALHNKIQDDISTVFRQVAFFNFELELHTAVRSNGWVPKEEIAKMLVKHLRTYLGKGVEIDELDGYSFVHIGHFRNYFYVYSYAFGQLISSALFNKYKNDKNYINKIDKFLSDGGSMTPEQIFKNIGVDITKPEFWQKGIDAIADDIKRLRKLVKMLNKGD
ncbi:MAG: M3 family oligoendopeptidase [Candidatus Pacebacteria bacterium]|nr:M3 family oligoendopeptidase [Candidatus Paceibacterota bacterium]